MQYHGISTTRAARIQARVLNAIGSSHACTSTSDEATAATTMYDVVVSARDTDAAGEAARTGVLFLRTRCDACASPQVLRCVFSQCLLTSPFKRVAGDTRVRAEQETSSAGASV